MRSASRKWVITGLLCIGMFHTQAVLGKELLVPRVQENTAAEPIQNQSFDDQEQGTPQSLFTWIKIGKGFEVEWDTFGRKGWYTQDPRLKPIEPGSVFSADIPAIYIIFEVAPLEDPAQFAVQWYLEQPERQLNETPIGKDVLEVPGHERYGYLELKRSGERWVPGTYVAKIYIAPLGQQPFHAVNQVGRMHFTVVDAVSADSFEKNPARSK